jgi:hypothetical protein
MAEICSTTILRGPAVADLGVFFSGLDVAMKVYEARELARRAKPKKS